ncbi:hypothetical protein ABNF97_16920 [Plantactinospora sp. B6F1]|uniref:hypothetical protein n=1 Tax=Plantactinospora sp. B6F1 TaxID=3158971 RepID=UPI0032D8CC36
MTSILLTGASGVVGAALPHRLAGHRVAASTTFAARLDLASVGHQARTECLISAAQIPQRGVPTMGSRWC